MDVEPVAPVPAAPIVSSPVGDMLSGGLAPAMRVRALSEVEILKADLRTLMADEELYGEDHGNFAVGTATASQALAGFTTEPGVTITVSVGATPGAYLAKATHQHLPNTACYALAGTGVENAVRCGPLAVVDTLRAP